MGDSVKINYTEGMKALGETKDVGLMRGKKKVLDDVQDDVEDHNLQANVGTESQDLSGPSSESFLETSD